MNESEKQTKQLKRIADTLQHLEKLAVRYCETQTIPPGTVQSTSTWGEWQDVRGTASMIKFVEENDR